MTKVHLLVATKHTFCRDKSMLAVTKVLFWQIVIMEICKVPTLRLKALNKHTHIIYKHIFVMTNSFVMTNFYLSQQAYFCRNKHVCCDKTCLWSQQKYACNIQIFVVTKVLSQQKYFFMTNIMLSWQKFCRSKHTFVATKLVVTKMILVAAPASVSYQGLTNILQASAGCMMRYMVI